MCAAEDAYYAGAERARGDSEAQEIDTVILVSYMHAAHLALALIEIW